MTNAFAKHFQADGSFKWWQTGDTRYVSGTPDPLHDADGKIKTQYQLYEWLEAGGIPDVVEYVAPPEPEPQHVFSKLSIRRAMREMEIEYQLNNLLNFSPIFRADWTDAIEIDLNDPILAQALSQSGIDLTPILEKLNG